MEPFRRSIAAVVGIKDYRHGIPRLRNARKDAKELARVLDEEHDYDVLCLTEEVTRDRLESLFRDRLKEEVQDGDRLLVYYAGHGLAEPDETGLTGYLIPEDGRQGPKEARNFFSMDLLWQYLCELPCHHLLLVLDCCYAGAVRGSVTRESDFVFPEAVSYELFQRYVHEPVTQVLASSAHDQPAYDWLWGVDRRGPGDGHSPFAQALFDGLEGEADLVPHGGGDGLVTALELYTYLYERVERLTLEHGVRQTPVLLTLRGEGKSQYVFEVPEQEMVLEPAPDLAEIANPYRGLKPYLGEHEHLFCGREKILEKLRQSVEQHPLTVIVGPSGTGKSSLLRAGLLPPLGRERGWRVLGPMRPTNRPLPALASLLESDGAMKPEDFLAWLQESLDEHPDKKLLLAIDQFEELMTMVLDDELGESFQQLLAKTLKTHPKRFRIVLTVRSDFEPPFAEGPLSSFWDNARRVVPPMTHDELRDAILTPASQYVFFFEDGLVEELVEEVLQMPGALPLLSFTLRELFRIYIHSRRDDRTLRRSDYENLGRVAGSLRRRAEAEYQRLPDDEHRATLQRLMLRMLSFQGGESTRRQVPHRELIYSDEPENERVRTILKRFSKERLIVEDHQPGQDGEAYVEPAHDKLIHAWDRLHRWRRHLGEEIHLQRRVSQASDDWIAAELNTRLLWRDDPRRRQLRTVLDRPENWLNARETEFYWASQKAYDDKIARRGYVAILAAMAIVWWVTDLYRENVRLRYGNVIRSLTQQVLLDPVWSPGSPRPRLLARQAFLYHQEHDSGDSVQVDRALRTALGEAVTSKALRSEQTVTSVHFLPGKTDGIVTGSRAGQISLRDVEGRSVTTLPGGGLLFSNALDFSSDGTRMVSASQSGSIKLWDLTSDPPNPTPLLGPRLKWQGAVLSPVSGQVIGLGTDDQDDSFIRIWNPETSDRPLLNRQEDRPLLSLAAHRHQDLIAAAGHDGILIWRLSSATLEPLAQWPISRLGVEIVPFQALAFSPQDTLLGAGGTAGLRGFVWLVDYENPDAEPRRLEGPEAQISTLAFSPDGQWLAAASGHGVWLWHRDRWQDPILLSGHQDTVLGLSFSVDGLRLASGSIDGTLRFWLTSAQEMADIVCDLVERNLAWDEWNQYVGTEIPYARTCDVLPVHPSLLETGYRLARFNHRRRAIKIFRRVQELDADQQIEPRRRATILRQYERSVVRLDEGHRALLEAVEAFENLAALDLLEVVDGAAWDGLCWFGVVHGEAERILPWCDRGVERIADKSMRESRGIARAITGDLSGAIHDFEILLSHSEDVEYATELQKWIAVLRQGKNPFTPEVIRGSADE